MDTLPNLPQKNTLTISTRTIISISVLIAILFVVLIFFAEKFFAGKSEVSQDVIIEKITSMGKLELVKYSMKDVVEKKEIRTILPDKRILFVAVGEVTGCIDLTKVHNNDIIPVGKDSITVYLPQPEICYVKLDHQRSKVYDVTGTFFPQDTKDLVEDVYKIAEKALLDNAKKADVLGMVKKNALTVFKPFLESLSGKKVGVRFK